MTNLVLYRWRCWFFTLDWASPLSSAVSAFLFWLGIEPSVPVGLVLSALSLDFDFVFTKEKSILFVSFQSQLFFLVWRVIQWHFPSRSGWQTQNGLVQTKPQGGYKNCHALPWRCQCRVGSGGPFEDGTSGNCLPISVICSAWSDVFSKWLWDLADWDCVEDPVVGCGCFDLVSDVVISTSVSSPCLINIEE